MNVRRRFHGDDGASLVLALAFLALLGVFVASVLSLGAVSFENTVVTRKYEDRLYAADGGIEWGVQQLANQDVCPSVTGSFQSGASGPGTFTTQINGQAVTVDCMTTAVDTTTETSGGANPFLGSYGAIIRDGGLFVGGNNTQAPSLRFKGDLYSEGTMTVPTYTPLSIDGNLELKTQACLPANVQVTAGHTCTSGRPVPPVPNPIPTVKIPGTALAPRTITINGKPCTILYPGKYGSGGRAKPTFSQDSRYYLASGTYYFNDTGALDLRGEIFGGAPASTDTKQLTGNTPCTDDARARTERPTYPQSGKGVTIILGGNADFRVQSDERARIELFTRESPESGTTPGLSIWARNTATGTTGYNPRHAGAAINTEHKLANVILHGFTYLPNNNVALNKEPLNTSAGGASIFMGGLYAKGLTLNVDGNNGPQPLVASIAGNSVTVTVTKPRTTVLRATSTGANGTKVITAIVDRTTSPPTITSWREG